MVYLDNNATTPVDPRVAELVVDVLCGVSGNPASSSHRSGTRAAEVVDAARTQVAELLGEQRQSVIFTSGATEAIHIGLLGLGFSAQGQRRNFVIAAAEHKAVIASAELAARVTGGELRVARVDRSGVVDLEHFDSLVDETVVAAAVMHANNEIGSINPIPDVAHTAHEAGALLLCDVTQAVGKIPIATAVARADLSVLSSHKMYGPKGSGALVIDRHLQKTLQPVLAGGGQERGLRGGTQNVPGIAGFGLAAQVASKEGERDADRNRGMTNRIVMELSAFLAANGLPRPQLNGSVDDRLPNTLNLRFPGADADAVIASAPELEISTGSACQSAVTTPSHVLTAIGLSAGEVSECIRISLGRFTTEEDVNQAISDLAAAATRVYAVNDTREGDDGS